jgi:hypothetical protein
LLGSFDTPRRIYKNNLKFTHFFSKKLPVKVSNITVYKTLASYSLCCLTSCINSLHCFQVFVTMFLEIKIQKWKFVSFRFFWVFLWIIEVTALTFSLFTKTFSSSNILIPLSTRLFLFEGSHNFSWWRKIKMLIYYLLGYFILLLTLCLILLMFLTVGRVMIENAGNTLWALCCRVLFNRKGCWGRRRLG